MPDSYYVNLKTLTLQEYEKELIEVELVPSRRMLQKDIKSNFTCLEKNGIKYLDEVISVLKTPEKIKLFSKRSGISEEYLIMLKREIASSQPKPVKLEDFPGISEETIKKLAMYDIKNTKQLFDFVMTEDHRKRLGRKTGISYAEIVELTKLTDVCRIKWVGAAFARLLVDSPEDTVKKISKADHKKLYDIVVKINEEKKYFKGKFGPNDLKVCIIAAKNVPDAIQY
jgi:hypothetical protein